MERPETDSTVLDDEDRDLGASRARLIEVLESLEVLIKRQTSLKHAFIRGAVYGLGTVIGATLLLALLGGIIASILMSARELPFVGGFIEAGGTEEYVEPR